MLITRNNGNFVRHRYIASDKFSHGIRKALTSIQIGAYASNDENFRGVIAGMFRSNMNKRATPSTPNYGLLPCIFATDRRDSKYRDNEEKRGCVLQVERCASDAFGICCGMYRVSIRLQ